MKLYYLQKRKAFLKQPSLIVYGSTSCRKADREVYPPEGDLRSLDLEPLAETKIEPGQSYDIPLRCSVGSPYVIEIDVSAKTELGKLFEGLGKFDFSNGVLGFRFRDQLMGVRTCFNPIPYQSTK